MQGGLIHERMSVRLSVKRVNCDKTKETSAYMFIPYERTTVLVFDTKNGWLHLKLWAKLTPFLRKHRFSIDFRWQRLSRNTYAKNLQL